MGSLFDNCILFLLKELLLRVRRGWLRENTDLNDSQSPFDGIRDEQSSFRPDLLVLLHDEAGHFSQTFFIMSFRAEIDNVGRHAGHAALAEGGAVGLLGLRVHVVHHVDRELKLLRIDPAL